mmetsp:Transcript_29301/g.41480  ORF Transcript_29301/g.41480 Transcript_29301/m.41480 type:complete len:292 (-) Transcript_29301:300-1175(-)
MECLPLETESSFLQRQPTQEDLPMVRVTSSARENSVLMPMDTAMDTEKESEVKFFQATMTLSKLLPNLATLVKWRITTSKDSTTDTVMVLLRWNKTPIEFSPLRLHSKRVSWVLKLQGSEESQHVHTLLDMIWDMLVVSAVTHVIRTNNWKKRPASSDSRRRTVLTRSFKDLRTVTTMVHYALDHLTRMCLVRTLHWLEEWTRLENTEWKERTPTLTDTGTKMVISRPSVRVRRLTKTSMLTTDEATVEACGRRRLTRVTFSTRLVRTDMQTRTHRPTTQVTLPVCQMVLL